MPFQLVGLTMESLIGPAAAAVHTGFWVQIVGTVLGASPQTNRDGHVRVSPWLCDGAAYESHRRRSS